MRPSRTLFSGSRGARALAAPTPIRDAETKPSGRRKAVIALAIGAFLLLALLVAQASFNLKFISPDSNQQLFFFATLTGMIFFTFVALSLVLGRNLLKLYAERRAGVAGSKFRTRLVVVNLLLSFLPVIAMFWFSYGLMNRSIDKWFSQPVEEVRADTAALSAQLYDYAGSNATSEAASIAQSEEFQKPLASGKLKAANEELQEHLPSLRGGFIVALAGADAVASFNTPAPWLEMRDHFPVGQAIRGEHPQFQWGQNSFIVGAAPAGESTVLVAMPLPPKFAETAKQIQESQQRYVELARQRKLVRRIYLGFLLLLTVLVLFASTWLALFLSKLVNRPVAAIAAGTEAISKGQLDYRVDIRATDELAELVQSFNSMAEQLESSHHQIEASSRELGAANEALEGRRRYIETILESIPTGVVSIDGVRRVTLANAAYCRMFHPARPGICYARSTGRPSFTRSTARGRHGRPGGAVAPRRSHGNDGGEHGNQSAPCQAERGRHRRCAGISCRAIAATFSSSRIFPTCCARKSSRRGAKWRGAWPTRSRIRSPRSRSLPSGFIATCRAAPPRMRLHST